MAEKVITNQRGPTLNYGFVHTDIMLSAERVLDLVERWKSVDPDERSDQNIEALTGISVRWFHSLGQKAEQGGEVAFDWVDRLVTHLGLEHEWPTLMEAEEPEELLEGYCYVCQRDVLTDVHPDTGNLRCVWCSGRAVEREKLLPGYCAACRRDVVLEEFGKSGHRRCDVCKSATRAWPHDQLTDMRCSKCVAVVPARPRVDGKLACTACRSTKLTPLPPVRKMRPGATGSNNIPVTVLREAYERYQAGATIAEVVREFGPRMTYQTRAGAEVGLAENFQLMGWELRGQWYKGSERLLFEARGLYEQGYSMRQVVDIMWPRLKYNSKKGAMSVFYRAFHHRGWTIRDKAEVTRGRNMTHGRYVDWRERKDPSHPQHDEFLAFMREVYRERYYRGRELCKHDGCTSFAGGKHAGTSGFVNGKQPKGNPDYCKRHDPDRADIRSERMQQRNRDMGQIPVGELRPILDAWKAIKGGVPMLAERSGVPLTTLYRWTSPTRWPDHKLVRPDFAEQVRAVGLPDV